MSVEILPVGISCQLSCKYCYQQNLRDVNPSEKYQKDKVFASIDKLDPKQRWTLFGGEALILPLKPLEELLAKSFAMSGSSGVQTNGTLITEAHIALFKQYKTAVGISVDGPVELNDSRWAGSLQATRKLSEHSHWAIKRLCEEGRPPSIIVTLHAGNIAKDKFPAFVEWIKELDAMGVTYVNPHVLEMDAQANTLFLDHDEVADRMIDLWTLQETLPRLRFSKFQEILQLLQGNDGPASCIHHACDALNTAAVQSIDHDGSPSGCARTFKGEQRWLPAEGSGYAAPHAGHPGTRFHLRQLALYQADQTNGGCSGCPFWLVCTGSCVGEGEGGDWRKRTTHCRTWIRLFTEGARRLRAVGIEPLPDWQHRKHIEQLQIEAWSRGERSQSLTAYTKQMKESVAKGMQPARGGYHGDSHGDRGPE